MRYFAVILLTIFSLTACTVSDTNNRLGYQEKGLFVKGDFDIDGDSFPAELTLAEPEYDSEGRMLARTGKLIFSEGSVIEGIGFEFSNGDMYIFSDGLKIPLENEAAIFGISQAISLFCISPDSYHSTERKNIDGISVEVASYTNGDNRTEVTLNLSTLMPIFISAESEGRKLSVKIKEIRFD